MGAPESPQIAAEVTSSNLQSARSSQDTRILTLLGQGIPQTMVASTVGVTDSYVSQLISQDSFREELQELKFNSLQKHNKRDDKYDELEDKLVRNFETNMVLLQKPMEILKAMQVINSLKRRGSGAQDAGIQQQTVVNLVLPEKITQTFTSNINNQVTNIGEQTLETMQSSTLLNVVQRKRAQEIELDRDSQLPLEGTTYETPTARAEFVHSLMAPRSEEGS